MKDEYQNKEQDRRLGEFDIENNGYKMYGK